MFGKGRGQEMVIVDDRSFCSFCDNPAYATRFRSHLESVLDSLVNLMGETRERMTVQNTALKHLPAIVDPICSSGAYEPTDLWYGCFFLIFWMFVLSCLVVDVLVSFLSV